MNSATDHGYTTDWSIQVTPGLVVRHRSAEGNNELVVRRRHRTPGYWECAWLTGPRADSIDVWSTGDLLDMARAA